MERTPWLEAWRIEENSVQHFFSIFYVLNHKRARGLGSLLSSQCVLGDFSCSQWNKSRKISSVLR